MKNVYNSDDVEMWKEKERQGWNRFSPDEKPENWKSMIITGVLAVALLALLYVAIIIY